MKHLRIEYNNIVLFDGNVSEISWQDTDGAVSVTGKTGTQASGGIGNFFDLLSAAAKKQTEDEVTTRRADFESEKSMIVDAVAAE